MARQKTMKACAFLVGGVIMMISMTAAVFILANLDQIYFGFCFVTFDYFALVITIALGSRVHLKRAHMLNGKIHLIFTYPSGKHDS